MKFLFFTLLLILASQVLASTPDQSQAPNCYPGNIRVWNGYVYKCVPRYPTTPYADCVMCQSYYNNPYGPQQNWFNGFPSAIYQPQPMPWWATQGNFYYPNMNYPGAWNYPGINQNYYPGNGNVYALKPNIYVQSVHKEKKFSFSFDGTGLSFLATTPYLDESNSWKGKIIDKDKFEVDGTMYDYLFYDIRLAKEKMQFERGLCATKEEAIKWMIKDLQEMKYPAIAVQDFEEHWRVKIPDYPFYCIYPQYNEQLNNALPVSIKLENTTFTRALYVMVPHKKEPDVDEPQAIPFPILDSTEIRPSSIIKHETMFKEWGVAFLGQ